MKGNLKKLIPAWLGVILAFGHKTSGGKEYGTHLLLGKSTRIFSLGLWSAPTLFPRVFILLGNAKFRGFGDLSGASGGPFLRQTGPFLRSSKIQGHPLGGQSGLIPRFQGFWIHFS